MKVTHIPRAAQVYDLLLVCSLALLVNACTQSRLKGSSEKQPPKQNPNRESRVEPQQTTQPQGGSHGHNSPEAASSGASVPEQVPTPAPTPPPTPPPEVPRPTPTPPPPTPTPPPTPPPENRTDNGGSSGTLSFAVAAISNMEKGYQATNAGFRVLVYIGQQLVAAGAMTIEAVIQAERVNAATGSGFPAVALQPKLQYVSNSLKPGDHTGTIKVCMAEDPRAPMEASRCRRLRARLGDEQEGQTNGQLHRPFQWVDGQTINFTVGSQNDIKVTGYGGGFQLQGIIPNLATHHPIYAAAVGEKTKYDARSPIVLDLNGNGKLDLASAWDKTSYVLFDLEGDGSAEHTGWIKDGDALLAIDLNNNGQIDSGVELFGQFSFSLKGDHQFEDGFAALAQYDDNGDGQIDANDGVFSRLLVWRDLNRNGLSEQGELTKISEAGIASISLKSTPTLQDGLPEVIAGNQVRLRGTFTDQAGNRRPLADVWFQIQSGLEIGEYLAKPIATPDEVNQ